MRNRYFRRVLGLPEGFSIRCFSQNFQEGLEEEFRSWYLKSSLIFSRYALLLAIIAYSVFSILDHKLVPELTREFAIIRFTGPVPIALIVFFLSFFKIYKKYHQVFLSLVFAIAGGSVIYMSLVASRNGFLMPSAIYSMGLILVYIFAYGLLRMRFVYGVVTGYFLFGLNLLMLYSFTDMSSNYIIMLILFLSTALVIGTSSNYLYELGKRKDFFTKIQLERARYKVEIMNRDLEKKVLLRTSELEVAKNKAEESDRLKSAFLANMSHEIRTPMNGIIGFTDLLVNNHLDEQKRKKFAEIIHERANYLMDLLNNIIEISLIESGLLKFHYERIELNAFVDKLEKLSGIFIHDRNVKLVIEKDSPLEEIIIESDRTKLEQVMMNLISNAIKFTPDGGKVAIGYKFLDEKMRIYVKDSGPGIPVDQQNVIFQRFTKLEGSNGKFKEGSGLGLSIAKGLTEFIDGELGCSSSEGKGSTFYVEFLLTEIMQLN